MDYDEIPYYLWCDSTIALQWMNKSLTDLKLFVSNRVKRIRENTNIEHWSHIRTMDNPADMVSRGLFANEIVDSALWWHGPTWLRQSEESWPKQIDWRSCKASIDMESELKVHNVFVCIPEMQIFVPGTDACTELINYSNNLRRIVRIFSFVLRFVQNCKDKNGKGLSHVQTRARAE